MGEDWDGLVSDLYSSALDEAAAARLPAGLAGLMGGTVASMWRIDCRSIAPVDVPMTNVPPEALVAYDTHYYKQDPWADAVHTARFDTVLLGGGIVPDAELARSTYYNEFGAAYGMFHMIGALVPLGTGTADRVGVVSITRPRAAGAFGGEAVAALDRTLPHLRSAFQLREQVERRTAALRADALDAALNALGMPAAVLDGHGRVVKANTLAEGLPLVQACLVQGPAARTLASLAEQGVRDRLAALIAAAARGGPGGQVAFARPPQHMLATVAPCPGRLARLAGPGGHALLVLRPLAPGQPALPATLATTAFGLTQAEAEAACALAAGHSPDQIAAARGVKVSTVRTLLQRAQQRTGAHNLRDLVRILAALR